MASRAQIFFAILVAIFLRTEIAVAQGAIDPSSALLLNSGTSSRSRSSSETRLESSRYTVRPRHTPEKAVPEKSQTEKTANEKPRKTAEPVAAPSTPVVLPPTEQGSVVISDVSSAPTEEGPTVATEVPLNREQPTQADRLLEISIATAYFYESSESGYSFRQSTMGGPAYAASARVWFSPEFALGGSYISTLGGQVPDRTSAVGASRTEATYGLFVKKLFAQSNVAFGAEFVDSQFKVAAEAVSKVKTKSSGIRISIEGEFLSTPSSSWRVGFSATPKIQHEESPAATDVRSGTGVSAYAAAAALERRWQFDSANALFIRLEHKIERDLFTGSATMADPVGGATPNGVAVTVGTTLIQFGYGWGN